MRVLYDNLREDAEAFSYDMPVRYGESGQRDKRCRPHAQLQLALAPCRSRAGVAAARRWIAQHCAAVARAELTQHLSATACHTLPV